MAGKKFCGKNPRNKKSLKIKSYHFETLFLGFFSGSSMILFKKVPADKNDKNVYNHGKKGLDIKYAPGYIQYADA